MTTKPTWFFPEVHPDDGRRAAKHRLADAVRGLVEDVALLDATGLTREEIDRTTERVAEVRRSLSSAPRVPVDPTAGGPDASPAERGLVVGRSNAAAAPVRLDVVEDGATGWATYGAVHDGGAGAAHGAVVASAFMDVLACAHFVTAEAWGHIGTLTVRYRAPTPVGRRIDYDARIAGLDGRRSSYAGVARAGATVVAESEAVFIAPRPTPDGRR